MMRRLNEAAGAADATRGIVWQGNCDVAYHPSQNNFGGLRSITIEYPISNYPAKPPASFKRPNRKRSEEHTSELQSRLHLVCRLLLEKKKQPARPAQIPASRITRVP